MSRLFLVLIAFMAIGQTSNLRAQAVELSRDGKTGIWLPTEMARATLADAEELRLIRPQIEKYDLLIKIKDERIDALKEALLNSERAEKRASSAIEDAVAGKEYAESKLKVWYRKPALWFTIGAVATVILEVAAIALLKSL